jgi:hypothetical protein
MKAKTNLELFKNEIMYEFKHHPQKDLWDIMSDIYHRETNKKLCIYPEMLDWYSDVPRETLYLSEYAYKFINEYFNKLKEYKEWMVAEPLNNIICLDVLIKIGVIPSRYATMPFNEFIHITRLKESNK